MTSSSALHAWVERYYAPLTAAVLCLAAVNLGARLGSESVTQWDESLYATSALEMVRSGNWIGTTFQGVLDYYNSKPPLNIWLIALSFKAFGPSLVSLRLVSALSAWLTVVVLLLWTRRCLGPTIALLAALVLSTTFAFMYVHSGRTANTDALFTLLVLLTAVTLWAAEKRPWSRVWLGPILAAAFLLRGMAFLMPLAIVIAVEVWRGRRQPHRWQALAIAVLLFLVPTVTWALMRWQLDGWLFFDRLFNQDFVDRSLTAIEEHYSDLLYYPTVLLKYQYDWLVAALVAWVVVPVPWARVRSLLQGWRGRDSFSVLLTSWAVIALVVPTLMQTRVSWYLHPFYPVLAVGIAAILAHALTRDVETRADRRRVGLVALVVVATLGVSEGRLVWHSFQRRDLRHSVQGLLLTERDRLAGARVYRHAWDRAEMFVLDALVGATPGLAPDLTDFLRDSRPGDYLVSSRDLDHASLSLVRSDGHHRLYRRRQ